MDDLLVSKYFDYNATTPISDSVAEEMKSCIDLFANPSGINRHSHSNKILLNYHRNTLARLLGTNSSRIFFTSGGSEANNWAIKGTLSQLVKTPCHIITTAIEHPSVLETIKYSAKLFGFDVSIILPHTNGVVAYEDIVKAIRTDTQLISMMFANNETGMLQPVSPVAKIAFERNIRFHVDGVQVIGKRRVNIEEIGVDFLSLSAHKFYGPKGIGALYVRDPKLIEPLIHGGGQEMTLRSGTENLVAISGLSQAAADADANVDLWDNHCWSCKKYLLDLLNRSRIKFSINGLTGYEHCMSNTLSLAILGIRAEALAVLMEKKYDFIFSLGSACSNNKSKKLSHVLEAMQLSEKEIQSSIRISFGRFTTFECIRTFVQSLESCVDQLAAISYSSIQLEEL